MFYTSEEARKLVIDAGLRLLKEGLVARTWGNISARISPDEFVITPSGREYDDLKPEELVVVKVSDLSYRGNIKPSSEKILHAACYKNRPDCGFIIHTHQLYATAISVGGRDFDFAPCADYGFPGTQGLADAVEKSVKENPEKKSFLMTRHGAVVLGGSFEEAFELITSLEESSMEAFKKATKTGTLPDAPSRFYEMCRSFKKLPAYIDDFAQILGPSADIYHKSLKEICSGADAWAEEQILCKNCASMLYAESVGAKPMGYFGRLIQRMVYLTKYSKLKDKNK